MPEVYKIKNMTTHNKTTKPFYIALDLIDNVFHYGKISEGQQVSTKHNLESYKTQKEWIDRLNELKVYPRSDELENL
mgnify:CR=1 FL=1